MVNIKQVSAGYGKGCVLKNISLDVQPGKITTVLGRNGCGKSTLLKTVIGLLPIQTGKITIDGCNMRKTGELAKQIAYLPQSKNVPDITAGRLVLHGRFPYLSYPRIYTENDRKIAEQAMEKMGILDLRDVPLAELSGGMRQKVYLAMALAKQAPIVLMDEPTTYLDIGQQKLFGELVRELASDGKTVVLVLHDILLALKLSDSICVMEDGAVKVMGTPDEILASGILENLYGIEIGIVDTPDGMRYYYK